MSSRLGDAARFDALEVAGAEFGLGFDPELGAPELFAEAAKLGAAGGGRWGHWWASEGESTSRGVD